MAQPSPVPHSIASVHISNWHTISQRHGLEDLLQRNGTYMLTPLCRFEPCTWVYISKNIQKHTYAQKTCIYSPQKYVSYIYIYIFFSSLLNKVVGVRHPRRHTLCSIPPEAHDVKPASYHAFPVLILRTFRIKIHDHQFNQDTHPWLLGTCSMQSNSPVCQPAGKGVRKV